jgi:hypothetical protein
MLSFHLNSCENSFKCLDQTVLPDTDIMIEPSYAPLQVTFVTDTWVDKATVHERIPILTKIKVMGK